MNALSIRDVELHTEPPAAHTLRPQVQKAQQRECASSERFKKARIQQAKLAHARTRNCSEGGNNSTALRLNELKAQKFKRSEFQRRNVRSVMPQARRSSTTAPTVYRRRLKISRSEALGKQKEKHASSTSQWPINSTYHRIGEQKLKRAHPTINSARCKQQKFKLEKEQTRHSSRAAIHMNRYSNAKI